MGRVPAMNADRVELARLGAMIAGDLDRRGYPMAGVVRRLARELATLEDTSVDDGCPRCGEPVVQPAKGRRRVWCSAECRRKGRA